MKIIGALLCLLGFHDTKAKGIPYPVLCRRCMTDPDYQLKEPHFHVNHSKAV